MSIRIALIRGNGMNAWEGRLWNDLPKQFEVLGFCANNNLFPIDELTFPIKQLPTTTDFRLYNKIAMIGGVFQKMTGLEKELADVTIAHTVEIYNYYTYQAVQAKKLNRKLKVVTTVWDNSFARFEQGWSPLPTPRWWTKKMMRLVAANIAGVDRFAAVTEQSAKLLSSYGVPDKKISVLTPGLAEAATESSDIVEKLGLGNQKFFMMVNRLRKEKGVYECLEAWKDFTEKHNDASMLVIVGDGPERQHLLKLIVEWGIGDRVQYIPSLPNSELRQLYPHATALILASKPTPLWEEQFGYVLVEAMSVGCPVISTTSGAIPEVVGTGGILVPPGDVVALSQAMNTLAEPDKHRAYRAAALHEKSRFTAERFQKEIIKLYSEVV